MTIRRDYPLASEHELVEVQTINAEIHTKAARPQLAIVNQPANVPDANAEIRGGLADIQPALNHWRRGYYCLNLSFSFFFKFEHTMPRVLDSRFAFPGKGMAEGGARAVAGLYLCR
jgi:hypothetical protein